MLSCRPAGKSDRKRQLGYNPGYLLVMLAIVTLLFFIFRRSIGSNHPPHVHVALDGTVSSIAPPSNINHCSILREMNHHDRLIAIGDIHGSYDGLLTDLFAANLTASKTDCRWRPQQNFTTLVQMGDITDRGPGALESLLCLHQLQKSAHENNAKVVRLLGNHELWWLEGIFFQRNPTADTSDKIQKFIQILIQDIADGNVVAGHLHHVGSLPVVFVHAGFNTNFLRFLQQPSVERIVDFVNQHLVRTVGSCSSFPCDAFAHELYQAGPSRGGKGIGGPYWTDFSQLISESKTRLETNNRTMEFPFVQVVGHTMAFCYDPRDPSATPPASQAECSLGLVRATPDHSAICVDGGMYAGARAFLEIDEHGHFLAHERWGNDGTSWKVTNLTAKHCH